LIHKPPLINHHFYRKDVSKILERNDIINTSKTKFRHEEKTEGLDTSINDLAIDNPFFGIVT